MRARDPFAVTVRVLLYIFAGLLIAFALGEPKAPVAWPAFNPASVIDR